MRWSLLLEEYAYTPKYKKGTINSNADGLSRAFAVVETLSSDQFIAQQAQDSFCNRVKNTPKYCNTGDGVLAKHTRQGLRIVVPSSLRLKVLALNHSTPQGGHCGHRKTYQATSSKYFWPGMAKDVASFVRRCPQCALVKDHGRVKPPMGKFNDPKQAFEAISIDIVGPLPPTPDGFKYILTVIDQFSRFVQFYALKTQTAEEIAQKLVAHFCRFGTSKRLLSDQGRNLTSELVRHLCEFFQVDKVQTTAYHPAGNGRCERVHRTMARLLAHLVNDNQTDWEAKLPLAELVINSHVNETTTYPPFTVVFGRDMPTPARDDLTLSPSIEPYALQVEELRETLKQLFVTFQCNFQDVDVKVCASIMKEVQLVMNRLNVKMMDTENIVRAKAVVWLEPGLSKGMSMKYLSGETPWEFCLTYRNNIEFARAMDSARIDFDAKRLKPLQSPPTIGRFILVHQKKLFRGVIMKVTPSGEKMSVLDVDTHELSFVRAAEAYELPAKIAAFPAQTLRCCVNTSDAYLEKMWCKELRTAFKSWLDSNLLTVNVLQKLQVVTPPQVLIKLYIFNEESEQEVDLTYWINETVIAGMKKAVNLKEDILAVLEELDPFGSANELCQPTETTEVQEQQQEKIIAETVDEFVDPATKVSSWLSDCAQSSKTPERNRNGLVNKAIPQFEEPKFITASRSHKSSLDGNSMYKNPPSGQHSESGLQMSPDAPEFVPSRVARVVISGGNEDDDLQDLVADLSLEYQPKDDKRICRMFLEEGKCRRVHCKKEHVQRTNKWTDDSAEVCQEPFNHLDLPAEGTETYVKVEHVVSGHIFYITLNECYSSDEETSETLHEDLNAKTNATSPHPLLESLPIMGEYVLAMGIQRSLGPGKKWLRAEVKAVLDENTVEVFFVDFGNTEVVKTRDLRQIRPQFMHLPFQAVQTNLAFVVPKHDISRDAKRKLEQMIKGKELKAQIIRRDFANLELDVLLFDDDGITVNSKMIDLGFCTGSS
ncbi:Reverse transcriptase (RNA-dependent DNA polymerase) [Nesidiocoris tenuis]|nr:Reverse transcriptase (RNA-dependent DNA polymerase) [Nesidiocoris tenuis]